MAISKAMIRFNTFTNMFTIEVLLFLLRTFSGNRLIVDTIIAHVIRDHNYQLHALALRRNIRRVMLEMYIDRRLPHPAPQYARIMIYDIYFRPRYLQQFLEEPGYIFSRDDF